MIYENLHQLVTPLILWPLFVGNIAVSLDRRSGAIVYLCLLTLKDYDFKRVMKMISNT